MMGYRSSSSLVMTLLLIWLLAVSVTVAQEDTPHQDESGSDNELDMEAEVHGNAEEANVCVTNPDTPGCKPGEAEEEDDLPPVDGVDNSNPGDIGGSATLNAPPNLEEVAKEGKVISGIDDAEAQAYGKIVLRLEELANNWGCTTSGLPLFTDAVDADTDAFDFIAQMLSQALARAQQQYGSQLVSQYHDLRNKPKYECGDIGMWSEEHFENPGLMLLESKELLTSWLSARDVEPESVLSTFFTPFRSILSHWFTTRLLLQSDAAQKAGPVPEACAAALLPIIKNEDSPSDQCDAAGILYQLFKDRSLDVESVLHREINNLLERCYMDGRGSDMPSKYGEILFTSNRTTESRELFRMAVERGELCHPMQRPASFHRKDLTARAIWRAEAFPELKPMLELTDELAVAAKDLPFSDVNNTMTGFLQSGKWEKVTLYGESIMNEEVCALLGKQLCKDMEDKIETILDGNDAYPLVCNNTLAVEFWKLSPPLQSYRSTGATNMVLQGLVALEESDTSFVLHAAEESVLLTKGELVVVDDSFENHFVAEGAPDPVILLHIQMCHPELHTKAFDLPSSKCAK